MRAYWFWKAKVFPALSNNRRCVWADSSQVVKLMAGMVHTSVFAADVEL